MSSRNLKRQANSLLKEMDAVAKEIRQKVNRRTHILTLAADDPQLHGFIAEVYSNLSIDKPPYRGAAAAHALMDYHKKHRKRTWNIQDERTSKGRVMTIKAPSFGSLASWKTDILPGFFHGGLAKWKEKSKEEQKEARKGITGEGGRGLHLGHVGSNAVSVTSADTLINKSRRSEDKAKLVAGLQEIRTRLSLDGDTAIQVKKTGDINKRAKFNLIYESAGENLGKSSLEKRLSLEMRKFLEDVAFGESSRSVPDATLDTFEDALRFGKVKRTGTEKGRANSKKTSTSKVPVSKYAAGAATGARRGRKKKKFSQLATNSYLNARLANEVASRMGSPKLNYRTGRFADSVKVVSSEAEPKSGAVLLQYTYQKAPYEVFELGKSDLATAQRDPRLIIGQAIRSVAKELAITKMKLRRV